MSRPSSDYGTWGQLLLGPFGWLTKLNSSLPRSAGLSLACLAQPSFRISPLQRLAAQCDPEGLLTRQRASVPVRPERILISAHLFHGSTGGRQTHIPATARQRISKPRVSNQDGKV